MKPSRAAMVAVMGAVWAWPGTGIGDVAIGGVGPTEAHSRVAAEVQAVDVAGVEGVWTDHVLLLRTSSADAGRFCGPTADPRFAAVVRKYGVTGVRPALSIPVRDAALAQRLGLDRWAIVSVPPGTDTRALARAIAGIADLVEAAEPDPVGVLHTTPNDPFFSSQWALDNRAQTIDGAAGTADADIDWVEAWNLPHTSVPIVVAVLDTGVSVSHPDLEGRTVPGRCFICGTGDPANTDDGVTLSHGTLCAGIIGATDNNGVGISGVAQAARIMPVKVTTGLLASQVNTGNGLIWAADNGAAIASMSWGFGATSNVSFLRSAVEYAAASDVLMVASTGNTPGAAIGYPARWPEVIAVGATNNTDTLFPGTTTGPEMSLSAPGQDIFTTVDETDNPNGYEFASGTSMAAPMVAGAAAVIWSAKPTLSAEDVRRLLETTADDLGPVGWDPQFGYGRVNLGSALSSIVGPSGSCVGDFNGDGVVELADLFAFLQEYFAHFGQTGTRLRADVDQSGSIDVEDIFVFMAGWFAGC